MPEQKVLLVIDVSSLLYRAFFALPPLKTKSGIETGAVYGFTATLFKAIKDTGATYAVACFDSKEKTFRHEQFAEYKAHRPKTPEGIITQIPLAREVLQAFGVLTLEEGGFEADDIIATVCKQMETKKDVQIYIVSGDLDNLQLIDKQVSVYTLGRGMNDSVIYDIIKVKERFGVEPRQMNDLKALTGDASDNIPGAKGIGKKTAADIIQKYNTVQELYDELATDTAVLKPRVKEILKQEKSQVMLSRKLVETKKDVPVSFNIDKCSLYKKDKKKIEALFNKLEFRSLLARFNFIT